MDNSGEGDTGMRGPVGPQAADWPFHVVRIRTTHDAGGRAYDVTAGIGATPQLALAELWRKAKTLAQQAANEAAAKGEQPMVRRSNQSATASWVSQQALRFEVVDVRLTPAVMEDGDSGWLAYGTLAREGESPRASTTGRRPRPAATAVPRRCRDRSCNQFRVSCYDMTRELDGKVDSNNESNGASQPPHGHTTASSHAWT
jgi:hypothetical protein